ncbi:MAG: amidohydrolase family protein, partial [Polymorphobacter sp.]
AAVQPDTGDNIFGGQGALITLAAGEDILLRPRAFQYIELGEDGARKAGGSRPAAWLELRNALQEAQRYARSPAAYTDGRDNEALVKRLDAAALVPVVEGRMPLMVHVERASDILNVLRLPGEFPKLRIILLGAREGWTVAEQIAAAKVPVITMALMDLPDAFETLASTRSNAGRLVAAGVLVGLGMTTDGTGNQPRNLPQQAGNAVAQGRVPGAVGLTPAQALAAMTRSNARILGMDDVGTLEAGKTADIVVWDGDPLELASAPSAVIIGGIVQPTVSRQTLLRDRYLNLQHDQLPLAYPR